MKILVLGGVVRDGRADHTKQGDVLARLMRRLGRELAEARFTLVACSPYDGAADIEAVRGWTECPSPAKPSGDGGVELHCPDDGEVTEAVQKARRDLGLTKARIFTHPSSRHTDGRFNRTHSWLLAQMSALDSCSAVVAIGGNPGGAANLLLQVAEARRRPVLPLGHLGGAAGAHLERHRYELRDLLRNDFEFLKGPDEPEALRPLIERLTDPSTVGPPSEDARSFFISYPRERPAEADHVETTLRRRNCVVYRDEQDFEPGGSILAEISEGIHKADIFLALWCREYACSPWCNDELELALDRKERSSLRVVLLDLDGTRVVPRRARGLINYPAGGRSEMEAVLLRLIGTAGPET